MGEISKLERSGWNYRVLRGGQVVAKLQVVIKGNTALLHNQVDIFNRALLFELRGHFETVRQDLREAGIYLMIAATAEFNKKVEHYWRLMGFECFGKIEEGGHLEHFAVMEA